jgi:hypothetical protein
MKWNKKEISNSVLWPAVNITFIVKSPLPSKGLPMTKLQ